MAACCAALFVRSYRSAGFPAEVHFNNNRWLQDVQVITSIDFGAFDRFDRVDRHRTYCKRLHAIAMCRFGLTNWNISKWIAESYVGSEERILSVQEMEMKNNTHIIN